jgi:thiosulfate reductase cytochrome b subunit
MARVTAGSRRKVQRFVHLAAAVVLFAYVYLPMGAALRGVVRYGVFPLLALTGIGMWKAAWIRRALRRRAGAA